MTTAVSTAAAEHEPSHTVTSRSTHVRRRPARFVETVRSRRLPDRNHSASRTRCLLASSDVDTLCCRHFTASGCYEQVNVTKTVAFVRSCWMSVDSAVLRCADAMAEQRCGLDSELSDSDVVSWVSDSEDRSAGVPAYAFKTPASDQTTSGWLDARGGAQGGGGSSSVAPLPPCVLREQNIRVRRTISLGRPANFVTNHACSKHGLHFQSTLRYISMYGSREPTVYPCSRPWDTCEAGIGRVADHRASRAAVGLRRPVRLPHAGRTIRCRRQLLFSGRRVGRIADQSDSPVNGY